MKTERKETVAKIRFTICFILLGMVLGALLFFCASHSAVTKGEQKITSTEILNSFADIEELAVEEYYIKNVGKFSEEDMELLGIPIPFTGKSFLLTYSGTVKAGIKEFSQIETNIDKQAKQIEVLLPKAQVLDAYLDPSSIETYDQSFHPFNQIEVADVTKFEVEEVEKLKDLAVEQGVLERAQKREESIFFAHIHTLLANTEYQDYEIKIKQK